MHTTDLDWLRKQSWTIFRPSAPVDPERLREFARVSCERGADSRKAYDYSGALGFKNVTTTPDTLEEIPDEFTCVTLIQAALHYAGHPTRSIHRNGILDIVTPAQVIHSSIDTSPSP